MFRAILKSEVLREAISNLEDLPGASTVRLRVSHEAPHFHLASGGTFSSLDLFLPRTSEARGWVSRCLSVGVRDEICPSFWCAGEGGRDGV